MEILVSLGLLAINVFILTKCYKHSSNYLERLEE